MGQNMSEKNNRFKYALFASICLAVFCMGMFLFLLIKYKLSGNFDLDAHLINFSNKIQNQGLTNFFKVITHFGSMLTVAILAVIMAIICKPIWVKIFAIVNVGFVGAFCFVVKHIIKRPRPEGIALITETGFSFPSAHTMGSVVFYGFLVFLIWKYLKNKPLKIIFSIILPLLAILIGYTRVYLGVHFATDVIAGLLAGIAYLAVAIILFMFLEKKIKFKGGKNEKK